MYRLNKDRWSINIQICKQFQNLGHRTLGPVVLYYGLEAESHKGKLRFFKDNGAFRRGETQETQFYHLVEVPLLTSQVDLKYSSSRVDIWPVLRAAEFNETSDIEVLGTGNPEPLLVRLSKFLLISLHPMYVISPFGSLTPLWIAYLAFEMTSFFNRSTSFNSIVLVPLMFSIPPCTMEAHMDPCSKIICLVVKWKVRVNSD
ncbi:hypothetical protein Cgig2_013721 [Carnegiea gigantea]|uniref:Uncharacterized protein n=1 Tax=Carnegiea gigantea TaxID=171969 RepID=A0A9Q1QD59_9CARY|nr:hypothetical protein Cgig2_013721 [Carnegiea gigantea]